MKGLGWDLRRPTAEERAREVIQKSGIDAESFTDLKGSYAKGSSCDITFKTVEQARSAKEKVKTAAMSYPDSKGKVFMDVARTSEESAPFNKWVKLSKAEQWFTEYRVTHADAYFDICGRTKIMYPEDSKLGHYNMSSQTWTWDMDEQERPGGLTAAFAAVEA